MPPKRNPQMVANIQIKLASFSVRSSSAARLRETNHPRLTQIRIHLQWFGNFLATQEKKREEGTAMMRASAKTMAVTFEESLSWNVRNVVARVTTDVRAELENMREKR
jgi:hypothetical protein